MVIHRRFSFGAVLLALATGVGCNGDTPTSPTATATTATAAAPAYTEEWIDTLSVGGTRFYSFTVTQYGTVNVALTSVSGQFVPGTVTVGLGIGTPAAETCSPTSSISTQSGTGPQLTGAYNPGVYCVIIRDVGNLFAAARFSITVAYP
ncbi:MAG: hypothetical protein K2Y23_21425 [Cyanobacteria bacterium]|nr:hypothetical protein [Cyanobacteriota bacterium]